MTDREWTLLVWALLGLVVVTCLVVSAMSKGRFPGPGALVRRIATPRAGRALLVLGWMWLGWHLIAR